MVDLKKEIKLSDLFGRKPKAPKRFWKRDTSLTRADRKGSQAPTRLVGLKTGASGLAAARIANTGQAELLQLAREPLDPGVVVGGELRDPEALAEALKVFFRKHKLPRRGVRLGIANNRIGVRTLALTRTRHPKH